YTLHGSGSRRNGKCLTFLTCKKGSDPVVSYAVVHMQKIKAPALKGIQIHHQREKESHTNPDIDYERTHENYDLVNNQDVEFHERVKGIIESQKVGTRKTRKDAVLVNELLVTSDEEFFKNLSTDERDRFFKESHKLFAERYGEQNIAYARVHLDEKTPHMHLGVVPMRDGKLQGKNVFNRKELQWLQDTFPKHMQELGFELQRGEKGTDRKHIEMTRFKKETLDKEIQTLEKELALKRNEAKAYVEKSDDVKLDIKAKKQYKNVEVPTGEKTILCKEKTEMKRKETCNVIISRKNYAELINAAKENKHLRKQVMEFADTDIYKYYDAERTKRKEIEKKYSDLEGKYKEKVKENNELAIDNDTLKSRVKDLTNEIGSIYKSAKSFLKERTSDLKTFRSLFSDLVNKVKEKSPKGEFERLERVEKKRDRDRGMSL